MRIFVLGDSFADNLFAEGYSWINKWENDKSENLYDFCQLEKYLISMKNENIDKAKWFTDWLEEWGYEVINLGKGGCSNENIFYQFAQIDKEFKEGDRIILHWSDHCRFDWAIDEHGRNISVHPRNDGFDEPLKSILSNHSVCRDESFKSKFGYLNNNLIPFMDWIVEKHSEYNPIVWSVFINTMKYLNKDRHFDVNCPYFLSFLENKWTILKETNGMFRDGHFGRYGNYYLALLFDELIKGGITTNMDTKFNKSRIIQNIQTRIKNENVIFKNPKEWPEAPLGDFENFITEKHKKWLTLI
jgi:hypothetical protein